jgi:hypothetical protein
VPLSAFFASTDGKAVKVTDAQRAELLRWFWRACFSRRFSAGVVRNLNKDVASAVTLREGADVVDLASFSANIDVDFFTENTFTISSVNTRTMILLLAQAKPLSLVSGQPVGLAEVLKEYNRNEFHHLYPRSYLKGSGITQTSDINRLANFAFISSVDNKTLGGLAPSAYKKRMPAERLDDILDHALCPAELFDDDYRTFLAIRAEGLRDYAVLLMNEGLV